MTQPKRLGGVGYVCLIGFALVILLLLQHQYWHGENGHASLNVLNEQIAKQNAINTEQAYINNLLRADVRDLKTQTSAIEEHARLDLGLIKSGETFFQLSNAPVTYSRQMNQELDQEADAIEPIESLEIDDGTAQ
ncbi:MULTISPECIES: FtsB family cell division protein [unclassified Moraxella]|uniref:FtsB family cell division protein n=1 Tax=unclassified Moraxella TaxID=2685852 RepID=UPI002B416CD5|nr:MULTISPECIES: septum formation initiator family protein [unclassified Moraxella]